MALLWCCGESFSEFEPAKALQGPAPRAFFYFIY